MDYKEKLKLAKEALESGSYDKETIEYIFPELAESKDERVRNKLIEFFKGYFPDKEWWGNITQRDILTWLKKHGKQISTVETKLKIEKGKWYICISQFCNCIEGKVYKATSDSRIIDDFGTEYDMYSYAYKYFRPWTIQDAKDGDVLHSIGFHNDCIFIFNGLNNWKFDEPNGDRAVATGYCCLSISADKMEFGIQGPDCIEVDTVKPATKIQRNLLFQKMEEAGYEWNAEKKELKKIDAEWEPQTGDTFRKKGTTSPTYHLCNKREDGITFGFVENCEVGISGGEITIFALKRDYELVERPKSIEDVVEKELNKALQTKGEQKSWSEEDEKMKDAIYSCVDSHYDGLAKTSLLIWLKALEDRVQPQQGWSEEDKVIRNALTKFVELLYSYGSGIYDLDKNQFLDWLQKLENRVSK